MKNISISLLMFFLSNSYMQAQEMDNSVVIKTDIDHFWMAYDKVRSETDSLQRIKDINDLYINKGTDGLKNLMIVRGYKDYEFVNAILNYPKYWNSIRQNMQNAQKEQDSINFYIQKLKEIYPELKPANIYFSVGAFRSSGTYSIDKNSVLLGSEFIFAKQNSVLDELPDRVRNGIKEYAPYDIPLTAVHEYIHTQQKNWEDFGIIEKCVAEGVAEFVSLLVTGKKLTPAVRFGKENSEIVLKKYMEEIFKYNTDNNWLWGTNKNELKVNDLGYYIGYEISERYYLRAKDKKQAIKDLIELDYNDEVEFAKMLDGIGFFPMSVAEISQKYESLRPTVKRILEFKNGSQKVNPNLKLITIEFSDVMSDCCRSFDNVNINVQPIKIKKVIGWSQDKKRFSFEIEDLKPNTKYELIISNFAKEEDGNRLAPYIIEFKTSNK
ncbi:MAG: DUF2268 domain-containing putative Zn-dependent protease [Flavobacteriaceae bacterium]|jgi:hypothetical protein|nr:DUF2268 domain-containing putative Zn-dependent protease [Flavobacteriaceae bacterium]